MQTARPFLVGARRSGTTVFRLLLDNHPDLAWHHFGFEYAVDAITEKELPSTAQYQAFLETHRIYRTHNYTLHDDLSYPLNVDGFLSQVAKRANKRFAGATVHHNFDRLARIWPNGRFVYVIRDPRGVAASNLRLGWATNGWTAADSWARAEREWAALKSMVSSSQCMEICYEDLVADPAGAMQAVCSHIQVPFDTRMLNPGTMMGEPPNPRHLDKWRHQISDHDVALLEGRLGDRLVDRGYIPANANPKRVGALRARYLQMTDRLNRAYGRAQHYGMSLYVRDVVSRRLGLSGTQRTVAAQINLIDDARLERAHPAK